MNQSSVYMCSPSWTPSHLPPHPIPQGHPSALALSTLSHASNLDWCSISPTIIYMFQCYSLKSFHPCLLPQNPKDSSIHLCLFCCLAYRVIVTIFKISLGKASSVVFNRIFYSRPFYFLVLKCIMYLYESPGGSTTKPMCLSYWRLSVLEPVLRNKRSQHDAEPSQCNQR